MHFRLNNKVDSRQQNCAIIANAQKSEREEGREEEVEQSKEREGKSFALITIAEFYSICDSHLPILNEELVHTRIQTQSPSATYVYTLL